MEGMRIHNERERWEQDAAQEASGGASSAPNSIDRQRAKNRKASRQKWLGDMNDKYRKN